jgi:GNAT superfamily N-acetyltransferase
VVICCTAKSGTYWFFLAGYCVAPWPSAWFQAREEPADSSFMGVSLGRLPRLLVVVVLAFVPFEPRPALAAVELFRGMAIQLSYRGVAGRLMADDSDRAVLVWSVRGPRLLRDAPREVLAVMSAVVTGIALFVASNALLILVVSVALAALGISSDVIAEVRLTIVMVRLAVTAWRAVAAYRHDARLAARLPQQTGPRWALDLLAASPQGSGYGRALLLSFLEQADAADAEVVLNCDLRNVAFYRHHGFQVIHTLGSGHQFLMIRPSATARLERSRYARRQQLQGHLRKGQANRAGQGGDPGTARRTAVQSTEPPVRGTSHSM